MGDHERDSRGRNPRGQGERLRTDRRADPVRVRRARDDQALSLRAVARAVGIAATSVYLHFPDRDALVLAALEQLPPRPVDAIEKAEAAEAIRWPSSAPGCVISARGCVSIRGFTRCCTRARSTSAAPWRSSVSWGSAPPGGTALHGRRARTGRRPAPSLSTCGPPCTAAVSMRINQPDLPWPPLAEQVDRFVAKLLGVEVLSRT